MTSRSALRAQGNPVSIVLAGIGGYLGIGLAWLIVEILQRIPVKSEGLQFLGKPDGSETTMDGEEEKYIMEYDGNKDEGSFGPERHHAARRRVRHGHA